MPGSGMMKAECTRVRTGLVNHLDLFSSRSLDRAAIHGREYALPRGDVPGAGLSMQTVTAEKRGYLWTAPRFACSTVCA